MAGVSTHGRGNRRGDCVPEEEERLIADNRIGAVIAADKDGIRWLKPGTKSYDVGPSLFKLLFAQFTLVYRAEQDIVIALPIGDRVLDCNYQRGDLIAATNPDKKDALVEIFRNAGVKPNAVSIGIGAKTAKGIDSREINQSP